MSNGTQTGATGGRTDGRVRILFGAREVCDLCGLSRATLKSWTVKNWVRPVCRSKGGRGREHMFSGWQTVGLGILAAAVREAGATGTMVGRVGVVRAMAALANLDDELLLAEHQQEPHMAETVAAEISRASLTASEELLPEMSENLARVVAAIDRKVGAIRARERNRLR